MADDLKTFTITPDTVVGGNDTTGAAELESAAPPAGVQVHVLSDSMVAIVPASVTVPAGSTNVTFPISTQQVMNPMQVLITASVPNGNSLQSALRITSDNKVPVVSVAYGSSTAYTASTWAEPPSGNLYVFKYTCTLLSGGTESVSTTTTTNFSVAPGSGSLNPSQISISLAGLPVGNEYSVSVSCTVTENGVQVQGSPFAGAGGTIKVP